MKICVYCSSAQGLAPALYAAGEEFGLALARRGHTLVYGGYNAGLMGQWPGAQRRAALR